MERNLSGYKARSSAGKTSQSISNDYLAGFVEGEGCFYIGIVKSPETKTGWQVVHFFKVSQNPEGKIVLDTLKKRLDCGYIKMNSQKDLTDKSLAFVVRDLPSLKAKVIPFFQGKLFTKKKEDFEKFCQTVKLVEEGKHLTRKGMQKILEIAYSMNTGKRKFCKNEILLTYHN